MIRKEFKEIIPKAAVRLLIGFIVIAVSLAVVVFIRQEKLLSIGDTILAFSVLMPPVLLWIANALGLTAFSSEYKDNAFEYLLSTPFSNNELLFKKLFPRIIVLLTLSIPYVFIQNFFILSIDNVANMSPLAFLLTIILVFFCSFFLSLFSWKNIKMAIWIVYVFPMVWMGYILENLHKYLNISDIKLKSNTIFNISLFIIMIILGFAFYSVFKKFDIKSESTHKKKFGIYAGIPLMIIVIAGVISSILNYS